MAPTSLALAYAYKTKSSSSLLKSLFMSTLNIAAKSLVSVASNIKIEQYEKWRAGDHLRYMVMMMSWVTVWVLRVFMDHFPTVLNFTPTYLKSSTLLALPPPSLSSVATLSTFSTSPSSLDLILQHDDFDPHSVHALGRALTHVLALLNEIPATSRKYQFAMAMADKIMDGNFRNGHVELLEVNRMALSSAFARTLSLLNRSLQHHHGGDGCGGAWTSRIIKAMPMGSYISYYVKGFSYCVRTVLQGVGKGMSSWELEKRRYEGPDDVAAEKLAQELLWITNKLRAYGAVEEAMVQWSYATSIASQAFTANPRVQGYIVKISAVLMGDLRSEEVQVSMQVMFRLLVVWMPLFCHANNGLSYPFLTSFEKMEVESAMDEVISSLPPTDQEVILTNWLQDFTVSASDWPNLQVSYDRWCRSTRHLAS